MRALPLLALILTIASCGGGDSGAGCQKDTDCKGDRICVGGMCVGSGGDSSTGSADLVGQPQPDLTGQPQPDLTGQPQPDLTGQPQPDLAMGGAPDLSMGAMQDLAVVMDLAPPPDLGGVACGNFSCASGEMCINGSCYCGMQSKVGGPVCGNGLACCSGMCVDLTSNATYCGTCNNACNKVRADTCKAGACICAKTGQLCPAGLHCTANGCVCDQVGCNAGCCANGNCQLPSLSMCGTNAGACVACDPVRADTCAGGTCACAATGQMCAAGQHCTPQTCQCDNVSCPNGCCLNGVCNPGNQNAACGGAGMQCSTCTNGSSCVNNVCTGCAQMCAGCCSGNTCNQASLATCGANGGLCTMCSPLTADACVNGACVCSAAGKVCPNGQHCTVNGCICDKTVCQTGCCQNGSCVSPTSANACGINGSQCVMCDALRADSCNVNGSCVCTATGGLCPQGQHCTKNGCVCDATVCPNGCCQAGSCQNPTFNLCGSNGAACAMCDAVRADTCNNAGQCVCAATGQLCAAGLHCTQLGCLCDATGCTTGCCANATTCVAPPTTQACGVQGAACKTCDAIRANKCDANGNCVCAATGLLCAAGYHCTNVGCLCDATVCPNGCCNGNGCQAASLATCGVMGAACTACDMTANDTCNAMGQCVCAATGASCPFGKHCTNAGCVCDGTVCQTGCCMGGPGGTCTNPNNSHCGVNGATCVVCGNGLNCVGGNCQ